MKREERKKIIPIFYAADENYLPYLTVSLHSLLENANKEYAYHVYILTTGIGAASQEKLQKYTNPDIMISCVDVSQKMEDVRNALQLRDYYTGATYFRIFIAEMFPQYEKALYLDGDTVILESISDLYNVDLGDNLVGAVADGAVAVVPEFRVYTKEVLGIDYKKYFNAGILLMNLKKFREENFYQKFCALLHTYKFKVAQDQDYLNVLCQNKVQWIGEEWNRMPIGKKGENSPKLIHYNLTLKPWHYTHILYEEYFWKYARKTEYYERIMEILHEYSSAAQERDSESEKALRALCLEEAARADNYIKTHKNKVA